ncbi:MAG: hypothetical protein ACI81T_002679 [Bacteroidia bacterium]|jgi:hypothetical protein
MKSSDVKMELTGKEENYLRRTSEYLTCFDGQPEKCEAELNTRKTLSGFL